MLAGKVTFVRDKQNRLQRASTPKYPRLKKPPGQVKEGLHRCIIILPRKNRKKNTLLVLKMCFFVHQNFFLFLYKSILKHCVYLQRFGNDFSKG